MAGAWRCSTEEMPSFALVGPDSDIHSRAALFQPRSTKPLWTLASQAQKLFSVKTYTARVESGESDAKKS